MNRTENWSPTSVESLGCALAELEEARGAARQASSVSQKSSFRLFELDVRAERALDELSARVSESGETVMPLVLRRLSELVRSFEDLQESSFVSGRRTTPRVRTQASRAQLLRHRRKTHVLRPDRAQPGAREPVNRRDD